MNNGTLAGIIFIALFAYVVLYSFYKRFWSPLYIGDELREGFKADQEEEDLTPEELAKKYDYKTVKIGITTNMTTGALMNMVSNISNPETIYNNSMIYAKYLSDTMEDTSLVDLSEQFDRDMSSNLISDKRLIIAGKENTLKMIDQYNEDIAAQLNLGIKSFVVIDFHYNGEVKEAIKKVDDAYQMLQSLRNETNTKNFNDAKKNLKKVVDAVMMPPYVNLVSAYYSVNIGTKIVVDMMNSIYQAIPDKTLIGGGTGVGSGTSGGSDSKYSLQSSSTRAPLLSTTEDVEMPSLKDIMKKVSSKW